MKQNHCEDEAAKPPVEVTGRFVSSLGGREFLGRSADSGGAWFPESPWAVHGGPLPGDFTERFGGKSFSSAFCLQFSALAHRSAARIIRMALGGFRLAEGGASDLVPPKRDPIRRYTGRCGV